MEGLWRVVWAGGREFQSLNGFIGIIRLRKGGLEGGWRVCGGWFGQGVGNSRVWLYNEFNPLFNGITIINISQFCNDFYPFINYNL